MPNEPVVHSASSETAPDPTASRNDSSSFFEGPGRKARIALIAMIMLSAVGFGIALELTDVFYKTHTDPTYVSMCAISEGANCQTVASSEYSVLLDCPVSVWAMAGYLFFAFLSVVALTQVQTGFALGFLTLMGVLFLGVSAWLVILMSFIIKSICILCVAIDFVNIFLFTMVVLALRCAGQGLLSSVKADFKRVFVKPLWLLLLAAVGFGILGGAWGFGHYLVGRVQLAETPAQEESAQCDGKDEANTTGNSLQMGVTPDGTPWIGAANPVLEVEEFTDYQCPYCRRAHRLIRQQLSKHADQLRVYHRHYPLDQACNPQVNRPFHRKACEMSRMAVCAQQQGRFWEMNDYLFENSAALVKADTGYAEIAERLELDVDKFSCCMADSKTVDVIKKDIEDGVAAGVEGTPSFRINGQLHVGAIPDSVLKTLEKP